MILIINICKEKLHYFEFVKPIEDILKKSKTKFFTIHYKDIIQKDIAKADKVIICGTSLKDNDFLENLEKFEWLKGYPKPVLGICGGMQIIGIINGKKLIKKKQIGLIDNKYHIHNFGLKDFKDELEIENYRGYLFHPEVRNKELIEMFAKD